mgnify:FL=1
MKKQLKILLSISFILSGIVVLNTNIIKVNAKPLEEKKPVTYKSCLSSNNQRGTNYTKATDRYKPSIYIESHFPSTEADGAVRASIRSGIFDVYVYRIIDGIYHEEKPVQQFSLGGSNSKSHGVSYTQRSTPQDLAIVFVLRETDDLCEVTENSKPIQNRDGTWTTSDGKGYIYYYYLGIPAANESKINNINYNKICAALRNSNYDAYASVLSKYVSREDFQTYWPAINNDTNKRFSYCYNQSVPYNYTEKEIAKIVKNKITAVKISSRFNDINETLTPPTDATLVSSTDFTGNNSLQCPAYQTVNGAYFPNTLDTTLKYYKTETTTQQLNVYTSTGSNTIDGQCKKQCQETITVTYGPPAATRGGLCFEYKVKVKSEVECKTAFTVPEPKPEDYQICTPTGSCNGGTYHSASGPNEEFDSCIISCDGGEYTQSCINKCYKSVYEKDETLPLSYENNALVKQMKETTQFIYNEKNINELSEELRNRYNTIISTSADNIGPGKTYSLEDLQIAIAEAGTGYYSIASDGTIKWNSGNGRYWEILGRYYPLVIPEYAVTRLQNANRCNSGSFLIGGKRQCGISLIDTGIGILRNNTGSSYCTAACSWYGCTAARSNNYYRGYPKSPGNASNRQFMNSADAIDVYQKEVEAYEAAANSCKTAATCSTNTATFTIKVNNKLEKSDGDNFINYDKASLTPGSGFATKTDSDNIILENDFCYNSDKKSDDSQRYLTEWSFPGTWINNKTGQISYEKKTDSAWHEKKNKFCTNLNSAFANKEWWQQKLSEVAVPADQLVKTFDYNINATTRNFGYFGWNFDINCFYAIYDKSRDKENGGGGNGGGNSGNNDLLYRLRTVELEDVFPSTDGKGNKESTTTGRDPGFNWTGAATNLKNSAYRITPAATVTAIQSRKGTIYEDKEQYLDYEFVLDKETISKIRNTKNKAVAQGYEDYTTFSNNFTVVNGVSVYKSPLITEFAITRGNIGCNNDGYGSKCEELDKIYYNNNKTGSDTGE